MNQSRNDNPLPSPDPAWPRQQRQQTTIEQVLTDAILAQSEADRRTRTWRAVITGEMVMDAALPRGKLKPYWMAQCAARIISFGVGMVGLVCGAYLADRWSTKRSEGGITVAANGMAMIIDGFAAANLLMPKIPRVSPFALFCLDFVMFIAALTAGCLVGFSDKEYIGDRPWGEILSISAAITWTVAVLRVVFHVWSCIDRKKVKKTRQSMRRTLQAM